MAAGLNIDYKQTRLMTTAHFYPYRLSLIWNKLPDLVKLQLRHLTDSYQIKKILLPYYTDRLANHFDPVNTCTWVTHCACTRCRPV